jgi:predicted PurR-regulated permease PerM
LSLATVYLVLLALLVLAGFWLGSRIVEQSARLAEKFPELVKNRDALMNWPLPSWLEPARAKLIELLREQLEGGVDRFLPLLKTLGQHLWAGIGNLGVVLLVPVFAFYFLKDGRRIRLTVLQLVGPGSQRRLLEDIIADMHLLLAKYIRALLILSAATLVAYDVFFQIIGVPYAVLLATLAALLEFIPVLGPLVASIVCLLVAAISGYPHLAYIVIFLVAYRLFQDYVLQPYLMSSGIALHPLLVLFGVLAGEQIAGIAGMFLSVPVLATARIVFLRLQKAHLPDEPV